MSKVTQVTIKAPAMDGFSYKTCWLDKDPRIKKGVQLRIKDDNRWWLVTEVYGTEDRQVVDNRGWDNNNYDKHESTSMKDRLK